MNTKARLFPALFAGAIILAGCASLQEMQSDRINEFRMAVQERRLPFFLPPGSRVDTVFADPTIRQLVIRMSKEFSYEAYRPQNVQAIYGAVSAYFKEGFDGYGVSIQTLKRPIEDLIPNYFREDSSKFDRTRLARKETFRPEPVVRPASRPATPTAGLQNRNIVLWHSHGWYYNKKEDRWEWQRPRLFQTVEDLIPMSVTIPYLVPMLENAGANTFLPRERDLQTAEVLVDNDGGDGTFSESTSRKDAGWSNGEGPGFAPEPPPFEANVNLFLKGTHRITTTDTVSTATATWTPVIPHSGEYAVTLSYRMSPGSTTDARYTVFHEGGKTEFRVNQQIGGGTWITLGTFRFREGSNPATGRVVLTNQSAEPGKTVSADAVRFGGGMGVVMRKGKTSGRAKYLEGARYYLQYAGMPDTLVYNLNKDENDYNDDYQSRAEYANYLRGAPFGPNKNRSVPGLGIPIDLTLAFHTDAGITRNDTTIGTLCIFSTEDAESSYVFPDSVSRLASRDLADILQTQLVEDLRVLYDPAWRRRQLMDSKYSEAFRPNFPGVLLELLSHQNFLDMKFFLDPRFRFDVARAVYKATLRFLSVQYGTPAVVQPLPPDRLSCEFTAEGDLLLRWKPVADPLEPGAIPDRYIVYTRVNGGGFDNGQLVERQFHLARGITAGDIFSFKVTAVNAGGESFPSEILSACRSDNNRPTAMIVNGFERISGPAAVETPGFSGFLNLADAGVPDRFALNMTGEQYDFNPGSSFRSNDAPGHGASFADREGSIIPGNSFDFPLIHGKALKAAGFSFVSSSRSAVCDTLVDLKRYRFVDVILGKQKRTHWQKAAMDSLRGIRFAAFPPAFRNVLTEYCTSGGALFVSGAHVGSELYSLWQQDSTAAAFGKETLRIGWTTDHAARTGRVAAVNPSFMKEGEWIGFRNDGGQAMYGVESPDALRTVNGSSLLLRYAENQFGAGTGFRGEYGVVVFGFPFETIGDEKTRDEVMRAVTDYLIGDPQEKR